MRLIYYWKKSANGLSPDCISSVVNKDGVSPLACLLTDDGGQLLLDNLLWLDEGIKQVNSMKNCGIGLTDWSRDAWGAELTKEQAKIYSMYSNDCFETLTLDAFEIALLAWRKFIQIPPLLGRSEILEI